MLLYVHFKLITNISLFHIIYILISATCIIPFQSSANAGVLQLDNHLVHGKNLKVFMSNPPSKSSSTTRSDSRSADFDQPFTRENERGQTQSMLARIHNLTKLILCFIGLVRASHTSLCYHEHLLRNHHQAKSKTRKERRRNNLVKRAMMTFANCCSSHQSRMLTDLHTTSLFRQYTLRFILYLSYIFQAFKFKQDKKYFKNAIAHCLFVL